MGSIDSRLLRALQTVARHGSVTGAAAALGLTQSTLSHSLARLRAHYGDELFVRTGHRLVATPFAESLLPQVDEALAAIRRAEGFTQPFDSAASAKTFRLHMIDLAEPIILPALLVHCASHAPSVRFEVVRRPGEGIQQGLETGQLDLAIGTPWDSERSLRHQRLFDQIMVGICRTGHPAIGRIETVPGFLSCRHCIREHTGPISARFQRHFDALPDVRRVAVQVPELLSIPEIVERTDLIACVPSGLVRVARRPGLHVFRIPIPRRRFTVRQHWHTRMQRDAANTWLRRTIREILTQAPAREYVDVGPYA